MQLCFEQQIDYFFEKLQVDKKVEEHVVQEKRVGSAQPVDVIQIKVGSIKRAAEAMMTAIIELWTSPNCWVLEDK